MNAIPLAPDHPGGLLSVWEHTREDPVGSRAECTKVLGLAGYRVTGMEWVDLDEARPRLRLHLERRGVRGYECSGTFRMLPSGISLPR